METIAKNIELLADMTTVMYPMVMKPNKWSDDGKHGGYYSEMFVTNMIKGRKLDEPTNVNAGISNAVNLIQGTPWTINIDTTKVIENISELKLPNDLDKVFPKNVEKTPPRPFEKSLFVKDMTDEQKEVHKDWAEVASKLKKDRQAKASNDMSRVASLRQANFFLKDKKFYDGNLWFPHDLDYRCRNYNKSMTGLNVQGSDLEKGLVKHATARQVKTERGVYWMKINMANLMGFDKLSLDDRVKICNDSEALIREVVSNPYGCVAWHNWDKPIQGLAAAFEYVKWLNSDQAFLQTHVQLDGLCNGVQNLAALTRDHKVAPHVGLVWTKERGDVYNFVLDKVKQMLNTSDEQVAIEWLKSELLKRELTKTPVMTRAYAATLHGIKGGVREFIIDKKKTSAFTSYREAGTWMGDTIWNAMEESLEGPMQFMNWSQVCAGEMAKANISFSWTNPAGMLCRQSKFVTKRKQIVAKFNGTTQSYYIRQNTNKVSRAESMSSCSPNLIHSCDASHLLATTNMAETKGVKEFAMVHDSFGTYPDGTQDLLDSAKHSWVKQYSYDWISHWYEEWLQLGLSSGVHLDLPKPTDMITFGNLDVKSVLKSDFFFA